MEKSAGVDPELPLGGSATGVASTNYTDVASTSDVQVWLSAETKVEPNPLLKWFHSESARNLKGKWVLLSSDLQLIDVNIRPGPLLKQRRDIDDSKVIFVDPNIVGN